MSVHFCDFDKLRIQGRMHLLMIIVLIEVFVQFNVFCSEAGSVGTTPNGLALHLEFVNPQKGLFQERKVHVGNLRIQGRMHFFEQKVPDGVKSRFDIVEL